MYIYVIFGGDVTRPRCKIGISANPEVRARQISSHSPFSVRLANAWPVPADQARSVEKEVHDSLADKRVHGEWFRVHEWTAARAIFLVRERRGLFVWPSQREGAP